MTYRFLLMTFLSLLVITEIDAQQKRAFMVGISHYDHEQTAYEWSDIHGKEDVQLLSPILQKQGFVINAILDTDATCRNILKSLDNFVSSVKKNSIVYVHFSTHGQPVEDIDGDESDGWDEALVPVDAHKTYKKGIYEGDNHILDDKLSEIVNKLRRKIGEKGFLYVAIDACHAGTSSRGEENVRGTSIGFSTDRGKIYNPPADKKKNYKVLSLKGMSKVLFLEACSSDQINHEIKISGKYYGALSYNIAEALKVVKLSSNSSVFLESLEHSMRKTGHWPSNQTMVLESSY